MSVAFVFPGQGSQSVGMLSDLAASHVEVTGTFEEASRVLGYDLWDLVCNGPQERLNQTEQTQPAMLAAGVATWRVWRAVGGSKPRWLDDEPVKAACEAAMSQRPGEVAAAVNFNARGQVVVAGHAGAVEATLASAQSLGARRAIKLPMSVPVHCELMRPATERLAQRLAEAEVRKPRIPVVNNADVAVRENPEDIRDALKRQLYQPVRWVEPFECWRNSVRPASLNAVREKSLPD